MEIIALKKHPRGYHGCLIDESGYLFFQLSSKGRFRPLKRYARSDFENDAQFVAIMTKYMHPGAFMKPPVPVDEISLEALDQVWQVSRERLADRLSR